MANLTVTLFNRSSLRKASLADCYHLMGSAGPYGERTRRRSVSAQNARVVAESFDELSCFGNTRGAYGKNLFLWSGEAPLTFIDGNGSLFFGKTSREPPGVGRRTRVRRVESIYD